MDESKKIHDITVLMHQNVPRWPGERHNYRHHYVKSFDTGDGVNISRINCSMHFGTHLDAPYHKVKNGKKLDAFPVDKFMGDAYVMDLSEVQKSISLKDIQGLDLHDSKICLFKTRNSELWGQTEFEENFVFIEKEAAMFLAGKGIEAVGIDYLSVDSFEAEEPYAHKVFFNANILVYEGLDLRGVDEGRYYFVGLPLRIADAEGSPVRAILIDKR